MNLNKVQLGHIHFINESYNNILLYLKEKVSKKEGVSITSVTLKTYLTSLWNNSQKNYLEQFDIIIPEGIFLVKQILRVYPDYQLEKNSGLDLITPLLREYEKMQVDFMMIGGSDQGAEKLKLTLKTSFPELKMMGPYSFNFVHEQERNIVQMILKGDVRVLFVGLQQNINERWYFNNKEYLASVITVCVGNRLQEMMGDKKDIPHSYRISNRKYQYLLKRNPFRIFDVLAWIYCFIKVGFVKRKYKKYALKQ